MSSTIFFAYIIKKLRFITRSHPVGGWDLVNIVEKSETKEELLKELDRLLKKCPSNLVTKLGVGREHRPLPATPIIKDGGEKIKRKSQIHDNRADDFNEVHHADYAGDSRYSNCIPLLTMTAVDSVLF